MAADPYRTPAEVPPEDPTEGHRVIAGPVAISLICAYCGGLFQWPDDFPLIHYARCRVCSHVVLSPRRRWREALREFWDKLRGP